MDQAGFHTRSLSFFLHLSLSWCLLIFFFFLLLLVHFPTFGFLAEHSKDFPLSLSFPQPSLQIFSFPGGPSIALFLQCMRATEAAEPGTHDEDEDPLPS